MWLKTEDLKYSIWFNEHAVNLIWIKYYSEKAMIIIFGSKEIVFYFIIIKYKEVLEKILTATCK